MAEDEFQTLAFVFGACCTYIYMNASAMRELVHKTCTRRSRSVRLSQARGDAKNAEKGMGCVVLTQRRAGHVDGINPSTLTTACGGTTGGLKSGGS
jgi:hypothetical protein